MSQELLVRLQTGQKLNLREQITLTMKLSLPAMLAQISFIIMQYIDASMVGQLGANDSASIGLVSSSTWLFGGVCTAAATGFSVQVAQRIGAGEEKEARNIVKQAMIMAIGFSVILMLLGVAISTGLPLWLGGDPAICRAATAYFLIYVCALPVIQLNSLAGSMLQSSGNMRVPSILHVMMCGLDVVFNFFLIFPTRQVSVRGIGLLLPGAGLGVAGAALGTALAELLVAGFMLFFLLKRAEQLKLRAGEHYQYEAEVFHKALKIAVPVAVEQVVMCGAMVAATKIVSPLGTVSIAANSFAVTAESLCYMPGYGIEMAAITLIGQSIGAKREELAKRLGWISTALGMVIMSLMAVLMYHFAPVMIGVLSPDPAIRELGTVILRIEAFAEPFYAASIVCSGVFRGAGDTFVPSILNFVSMWCVRIPLSAFLAPRFGLRGVWIAMCTELCVRGIFFLVRLKSNRWLRVYHQEQAK